MELTKNEEKLIRAIRSIELFNAIGSKDTQDYYLEGLDAQIKVHLEEANELKQALEDVDDLEILDGVVDSFVTAVGLLYHAENAGFNVNDALLEVCHNNMNKYFSCEEVFKEKWLCQETRPDLVPFSALTEHGVWFGFKNAKTGKIMKPIGHPPPDLSAFLPAKQGRFLDAA